MNALTSYNASVPQLAPAHFNQLNAAPDYPQSFPSKLLDTLAKDDERLHKEFPYAYLVKFASTALGTGLGYLVNGNVLTTRNLKAAYVVASFAPLVLPHIAVSSIALLPALVVTGFSVSSTIQSYNQPSTSYVCSCLKTSGRVFYAGLVILGQGLMMLGHGAKLYDSGVSNQTKLRGADKIPLR